MTEPLISLVIAVHNVEAHLPAFLDSLVHQGLEPAALQLVFVNDGSSDASPELIRAWITATGSMAEVVDQPNRGRAEARNVGLERAQGQWVSLPDPDDLFEEGYLAEVRRWIEERASAIDLLCTRPLVLDDESGQVTDTDPLYRRFLEGTRVVDLGSSPDAIHLSAATGFYRRERIEKLGLRFDGSLRPFEDGSFTARYLDASPVPRLGLLADAHYLHRRRADSSVLERESWLEEGRYTTVLERGYLPLLTEVARQRGAIPAWVQNVVLYDLLVYFRYDQSTRSNTGSVPSAWSQRFHELATEVLAHIDVETIDRFSVVPTSQQLRAVLVIGYKQLRTVPTVIRVQTLDVVQRLAQLRYFHGEPSLVEQLFVDGREAIPTYAKTRDLIYLNRRLAHERIVWVPATADIQYALDGQAVQLELGSQAARLIAAAPGFPWLRLGERAAVASAPDRAPAGADGRIGSLGRRMRAMARVRFPRSARAARRLRSLVRGRSVAATRATSPFADLDPRHDARIRREARRGPAQRRFGHAWTFMDRDTEAHDNAEHLYRYVRRHQPHLNAWFVLRRDSTDWARLEEEGFRLVPFGTVEHLQLLLNTDHLISSQADTYVLDPLDRARFGPRPWRFTFLQHGVTHNDLSRWLNGKPIDRFITASPAEYEGIIGDGSPYDFTGKEVRLTGFPRHDRLVELKSGVAQSNLILVMPTWRRWLMGTPTGGNARALRTPLASTAFGRRWFDFVSAPELRAIAEASELEIAFMPHPNVRDHVTRDDVPAWVTVHGYQTSDVQELLARAAVMVTDYSSLAFEAAYLDCPVVYFQFDRDDFLSGTHAYRKGNWDALDDGFGPVAFTQSDTIEAVRDAVERGEPIEPYRTRMRQAFAYRDGQCSERVIASILSLTRPATDEEVLRFPDAERDTPSRGQAVDTSPPSSQTRG